MNPHKREEYENFVNVIPADKGWYICDPVFDGNVVGLYEREVIGWSVITTLEKKTGRIHVDSIPVAAGDIFESVGSEPYCLRNPQFIYCHPFEGGFEYTKEDIIEIFNSELARDEEERKKRKGGNDEK